MSDKINGIVKDGIFLEAAQKDVSCDGCYFLMNGVCDLGVVACEIFKEGEANNIIFKFSQELTNNLQLNERRRIKLNGK